MSTTYKKCLTFLFLTMMIFGNYMFAYTNGVVKEILPLEKGTIISLTMSQSECVACHPRDPDRRWNVRNVVKTGFTYEDFQVFDDDGAFSLTLMYRFLMQDALNKKDAKWESVKENIVAKWQTAQLLIKNSMDNLVEKNYRSVNFADLKTIRELLFAEESVITYGLLNETLGLWLEHNLSTNGRSNFFFKTKNLSSRRMERFPICDANWKNPIQSINQSDSSFYFSTSSYVDDSAEFTYENVETVLKTYNQSFLGGKFGSFTESFEDVAPIHASEPDFSEWEDEELCDNPDCDNRIPLGCRVGIARFCDDCLAKKFNPSFRYPGSDAFLKYKNLKECTYTTTKKKHHNQFWYECSVCFPDGNSGVCAYCARECQQKNHSIELRYAPFFCDKGAAQESSLP